MPRTRKKIVKVKIVRKERLKSMKCMLCNQNFKSVKSKQQHLSVCPARQKNNIKSVKRCEKCNKNFIYKKSYLEHLKTEHSKLKGSVACNDCNVRCPDKMTLKQHILKAHENKKYPCPHCGLFFARLGHVARHMNQKGCGGNSIDKFSCEICGAWFSRKDNLMVHLRSMHINGSRYICKQCPATVKTLSRLISHVINEHTEKPYFECDTCGKSTGSKAALVKHMEIHGEKKYNCDVCGYTTYTAEVMRRHVLTHVRDKPYKCEQCSASFIQVSQLRSHVASKHTNEFQCAVCGENFSKIEQYAKHFQTHSEDKKLRCHFEGCPINEKVFKSNHLLALHLKKHFCDETEEIREHKCAVCDKWFSSLRLAQRHLATHALDRARRCMYCVQARAYVRGQQLLRHVRKSHRAVFMAHLLRVRRVLGAGGTGERLRRAEAEAVLRVLDAEAERVLRGYPAGVLYGGMHDDPPRRDIELELPAMDTAPSSENGDIAEEIEIPLEEGEDTESEEQDTEPPEEAVEVKPGALLSDEELESCLERLLQHLVDRDTLQQLGAEHLPLDQALEKLISKCGVAVSGAQRARGPRLRQLARLLLLHVLDDRQLADMLARHPLDYVLRDLLRTMADD